MRIHLRHFLLTASGPPKITKINTPGFKGRTPPDSSLSTPRSVSTETVFLYLIELIYLMIHASSTRQTNRQVLTHTRVPNQPVIRARLALPIVSCICTHAPSHACLLLLLFLPPTAAAAEFISLRDSALLLAFPSASHGSRRTTHPQTKHSHSLAPLAWRSDGSTGCTRARVCVFVTYDPNRRAWRSACGITRIPYRIKP